MKKKTFFTTMFLFLVFFNGAFLFLSIVFWQEKLAVEKEIALTEHYFILTSVLNDMQALDSRKDNPEYDIDELIRPHLQFRKGGLRTVYVFREKELLYTNEAGTPEGSRGNGSIPVPKMKDSSQREIHAVKEKTPTGERRFLYVEGSFPKPYDSYSLIYKYNLETVYDQWREMKNLLFMCGSVFSLLLSLCLLVLLNRIFRPLLQIAGTSREMTRGDFKGRLPEKGQDEVAAMAHSFNQMAATIEAQIAALKEAAEQKQRLVDNFAHELRTPLTAIYGYAEYLQKASVSEEDRVSSTDYIMSQCCRLSNLSQQLLELAALRRDRAEWEKIKIDHLFSRVEQTIQPKADSRGVTVFFEPGLKQLEGNTELLESLLINLIDNGIKACENGGEIHVTAYQKEKHPVLAVEDNGKGIPENAVSFIKEPFYRVDKGRSRKEGGAGLGLSICEQIALMHRARLEISSIPGKGTSILIIFSEI